MPAGRLLLVLLVALGTPSCDDETPAQPTVPSVAGRWEGGFQITGCVGADTCVPSPCRFLLGQRSTLRLTLQQAQARASGPLELYLDDPWFTRTGDVQGAVDPGGALALSGAIPQVDRETGQVGRYFDVTWRTVLDAGGASMSGEFVFTTRNTSGTGCSVTETADLTSLVRAQ